MSQLFDHRGIQTSFLRSGRCFMKASLTLEAFQSLHQHVFLIYIRVNEMMSIPYRWRRNNCGFIWYKSTYLVGLFAINSQLFMATMNKSTFIHIPSYSKKIIWSHLLLVANKKCRFIFYKINIICGIIQ